MHRAELSSLSAAQRTQLAQLIQQYATPAILNAHWNAVLSGVHNTGTGFLSFHRNYIGGLESFLVAQGHPEWSPLPAWDPATAIPAQFNIPNAGPGRLVDLTPNISFSPQFDDANLGDYETDEDLGMALMVQHNAVHGAVGGVMANARRAPEAPIFWSWHSFLDDIWWGWQRQTVVTPNCIGSTLTQARRLLAAVGLTVGIVTTEPHVHLPSDFPPIPWPPRPEPPLPPGFPSFPFPWPPRPPFPPRPRPHLHVVVEQAPEAGDRVVRGTAVNLILGMS